MSGGNVFADLGFEDAEEELVRADLTIAIAQTIESKRLTSEQAAALMGVDAPTAANILRRRSADLSLDRLIGILNLLGQDVEIGVRPKPDGREARVSVAVAQIY